MKIYPCNHTIKTVTDKYIDTDLNIPLSYVTVDYTKYKIDKKVNELFSNSKKTILLPNTKLNNNVKIFNEFGEELNNDNLIKTKNDFYYYYPNNIIEFNPKHFLWKATIKRKQDYKISNIYNINISAIGQDLIDRMAVIFSNPSERSIVPPNISINNNKSSFDAFNNTSCDFMFIETPNCVYYDESEEKINIYDYLDNNTNIWLSCKNAKGINNSYDLLSTNTDVYLAVKNPLIHNNVTFTWNTYFDLGLVNETSGIIIHNIFNDDIICPILILEYVNKGFVIISHYSITENMEQYSDLIYEVLLYVYLRSYKTSDYINEWITKKVPDYEVNANNILSNKKSFVSSVNLASYFNSSSNEYELTNISIIDDYNYKKALPVEDLGNNASYIKCIGKNNDKLVFEIDNGVYNNDYTEPEKPIGWISLYYNDKIYYLKDLHYLIETDITDSIFLIEKENDLLIKIYGFKNSSLGINKTNNENITIPFIKAQNEAINRIREAEYVIYICNNIIDYCFAEDYDTSIENQYELFRIIVGQTEDSVSTYDIRQLGGGLPEDEDDNYNLFDIGHINGRPYRIAGTLVITLPKKYEKYKDLIENIINKYKVAEDYIAIYYEDKEE